MTETGPDARREEGPSGSSRGPAGLLAGQPRTPLPRPIDRRTALRFLATVPPLALLAACSDGSVDVAAPVDPGPTGRELLPDLTGPLRDVHLRITARPATARLAPSVDTEVLRFDDRKSGEMFVFLRDGRLVQWGDIRALQSMPQ
jgi:hypothetical protein